jgi:hypothetical protein
MVALANRAHHQAQRHPPPQHGLSVAGGSCLLPVGAVCIGSHRKQVVDPRHQHAPRPVAASARLASAADLSRTPHYCKVQALTSFLACSDHASDRFRTRIFPRAPKRAVVRPQCGPRATSSARICADEVRQADARGERVRGLGCVLTRASLRNHRRSTRNATAVPTTLIMAPATPKTASTARISSRFIVFARWAICRSKSVTVVMSPAASNMDNSARTPTRELTPNLGRRQTADNLRQGLDRVHGAHKRGER